MPRKAIPTAIRKAVIAAARGKCAECGEPTERFEIDHHLPLSAGGTDERSNLRALGPCCHSPKSRKETTEFAKTARIRRKQEEHRARMEGKRDA